MGQFQGEIILQTFLFLCMVGPSGFITTLVVLALMKARKTDNLSEESE